MHQMMKRMLEEHVKDQSMIIGDLDDISDLVPFIEEDHYLQGLYCDAVYAKHTARRVYSIARIIWYIRAISLIAGFREGIERYERKRK